MTTKDRAFRHSPKYGVNVKDDSIYHKLDLKKRMGTLCNLGINQNWQLYTKEPMNKTLCPTCKSLKE